MVFFKFRDSYEENEKSKNSGTFREGEESEESETPSENVGSVSVGMSEEHDSNENNIIRPVRQDTEWNSSESGDKSMHSRNSQYVLHCWSNERCPGLDSHFIQEFFCLLRIIIKKDHELSSSDEMIYQKAREFYDKLWSVNFENQESNPESSMTISSKSNRNVTQNFDR